MITETLKNDNLFSNKIYWLNKLSGELPETNIMLDYVRPLSENGEAKCYSFELSSNLSQTILKLTKGSYFSIYLLLLSVLSILLQKFTGNNDIIVGIPVYEKFSDNNCQNSKFIPLRTQVEPKISFKDFLFQVQDSTIAAYSHQNYHFDELIKLLELPTSSNRCPIFDIVILLENIHNKNDFKQLNNDITFSFAVNGETITANVKYKENLFLDKNIILLSKYYINVIESIINNVNTKISDIVFLKESDKHQLLKEFNNNAREYPVEQTINKLFENQVRKTPNNTAVVHEGTKLTYQELNEKANQLARHLHSLGVRKGEFVGIFKDRDINFLIAILAIYKAGGAYVPIDSTYPANRIKYMLSNSEVRFLLTDYSLLNVLTTFADDSSQLKSIIYLDEINLDDLSRDNLEPINDAVDPAYMLYTSGSTGLPKGAIVRHDGAINHIYAQFDELELNEEFCFLQSAPSSTDISVWQFLAPLLIGGSTVIVDIETVALPEKLFKVLKSQKITVVELVPALFGGLLGYTSQLPTHERKLPNLKWMMVVGEPVSVNWVNEWLNIYPSIRIANAYGPTEAADDITQFIVDKPFPENQRTVPIGKPLANLNLYIIDREMQLLPIGVPGEICVSGIGVGAGYWKNQEKTNLSFVPNPFTNTTKTLPENREDLIYKTGDLGRWLPDGNIEFLGRIDHQVKIRGFRVELGEIETFLGQHPNVRENVVIVYEEEPGNLQVVAYLVAKTEPIPSISELRSFLKEKLPDHMLPSAFIILENLPLAPSGKIDRKALPKPDNLRPKLEAAYVVPRNEMERAVAEIWQKILKVEKVGIQDNFFDLGGHSLNVLQVYSKLKELFKADLAITDLFKYPTISSISQYLNREDDETFTNQSNELNEKLEAGKARLKQRLSQKKQTI
ncbi:MAG: amino acid adenylation domain-containing protein [Scytonematopsis contorta HA4267-MV1]|jgi:amino acid adenylation domain-containing protein|nr:amino acid adenylation domain-containing protein [Scytonematopsis contorta HA4267-MV1]